MCALGSPLFGCLAWMELDLRLDENVHLNVRSHISRRPLKYGAESFRCQPWFYVLTLVMNGTSLCLLSTFGTRSSQYSNVEVPEIFGGAEGAEFLNIFKDLISVRLLCFRPAADKQTKSRNKRVRVK